MLGELEDKFGPDLGLTPGQQAAAVFLQEMEGHLDSQVRAIGLSSIPWDQQMLSEVFHIKAGAVVPYFNGHLAILFLHAYLDTVGIFHGVADDILQDDFHGVRLEGKDQGTAAFPARTTIYLDLYFFILETQFLQFFYAMDQDGIKDRKSVV